MPWQFRRELIANMAVRGPAPAPSYQGPGDVPGWGAAYAHYGLRAYNAAFAAAQGALIQITDQSGAHATDIHCGTDGQISLSEIAAFKTAWSPSSIQIRKIYDHSGNNYHLDTNAVTFVFPALAENTIATTLPTMSFAPSSLIQKATNNTALAQPISVAMVIKFTGDGVPFCDGSGFRPVTRLTGNLRSQETGGRTDYTGVDNTWESIQSIINGASSSMRLNNTSASNGDPGSNGFSSSDKMTMGATAIGSSYVTAQIFEITVKAGAVSGTNQTDIYNNVHSAGLA